MPTAIPIAADQAGANEIAAAVAGVKYRVLAFVLSFSDAVSAKWQSGDEDRTGEFHGAAAVVVASAPLPREPARPAAHFETAPGAALNLTLSDSVEVGGYVVVEEKPVGA